MKKLVVRLSMLGVLSSAYVIGLYATSQAVSPHLQVYCCTAGNGRQCCGANGCSADATTCTKS
jgi:hypothetical protein